ncbi:hypothetical protein WGM54_14465 [Paenibacillus polymyxa]|uniref:hypothetical protein n=1 Tax=Paenibacillus polymyxa TaxID=1406 RepID=UPI00307ECB8C
MLKVAKVALSVLLLSASIPSLMANAQENGNPNNYDQYIKEAIEQEVLLDAGSPSTAKGMSSLTDKEFNKTLDNITQSPNVSQTTKQNIEKLENAEVILLDFDSDGELINATSSEKGDIRSNFESKEITATESTYGTEPHVRISTQSYLGNQGNTVGKETGAFHRLQTPASNANKIYNGVVADSIVLPTYNIKDALTYEEAAYLYTGVDDVAEVGFKGVNNPKFSIDGWYPMFHAKKYHTVESGDTNGNTQPNKDKYYYDTSKKFNGGDKINGYKVYYYSTDKTLTIREQINYQNIYVIRFDGLGSTGRSVKRLTAIGMGSASSTTTPFHFGFTTPAIWNNMKFLINNSSSSVYPSSVPGLSNDVWTHGGKIDYTKSGQSEKYIFSVK